ncbi:MAG: hypothetical protein Q8M40_03705 [Legionella sp.]|nr:hypothetical protein [Legionella sp.]
MALTYEEIKCALSSNENYYKFHERLVQTNCALINMHSDDQNLFVHEIGTLLTNSNLSLLQKHHFCTTILNRMDYEIKLFPNINHNLYHAVPILKQYVGISLQGETSYSPINYYTAPSATQYVGHKRKATSEIPFTPKKWKIAPAPAIKDESSTKELSDLGFNQKQIDQIIKHHGKEAILKYSRELLGKYVPHEELTFIVSRSGGSKNLEALNTHLEAFLKCKFDVPTIISYAYLSNAMAFMESVLNSINELELLGFSQEYIAQMGIFHGNSQVIINLKNYYIQLQKLTFTHKQFTDLMTDQYALNNLIAINSHSESIYVLKLTPEHLLSFLKTENGAKKLAIISECCQELVILDLLPDHIIELLSTANAFELFRVIKQSCSFLNNLNYDSNKLMQYIKINHLTIPKDNLDASQSILKNNSNSQNSHGPNFFKQIEKTNTINNVRSLPKSQLYSEQVIEEATKLHQWIYEALNNEFRYELALHHMEHNRLPLPVLVYCSKSLPELLKEATILPSHVIKIYERFRLQISHQINLSTFDNQRELYNRDLEAFKIKQADLMKKVPEKPIHYLNLKLGQVLNSQIEVQEFIEEMTKRPFILFPIKKEQKAAAVLAKHLPNLIKNATSNKIIQKNLCIQWRSLIKRQINYIEINQPLYSTEFAKLVLLNLDETLEKLNKEAVKPKKNVGNPKYLTNKGTIPSDDEKQSFDEELKQLNFPRKWTNRILQQSSEIISQLLKSLPTLSKIFNHRELYLLAVSDNALTKLKEAPTLLNQLTQLNFNAKAIVNLIKKGKAHPFLESHHSLNHVLSLEELQILLGQEFTECDLLHIQSQIQEENNLYYFCIYYKDLIKYNVNKDWIFKVALCPQSTEILSTIKNGISKLIQDGFSDAQIRAMDMYQDDINGFTRIVAYWDMWCDLDFSKDDFILLLKTPDRMNRFEAIKNNIFIIKNNIPAIELINLLNHYGLEQFDLHLLNLVNLDIPKVSVTNDFTVIDDTISHYYDSTHASFTEDTLTFDEPTTWQFY